MNILIAGGAGFIGSNLCRKLLKNQHRVYVIDNLSSGQKTNISDLLSCPMFKFFKKDISKSINYLNCTKFDQIYNLACQASPEFYKKEPLKTLETCFNGTKNLLELAIKTKSVFFQASTSEIYGDPLNDIQNELYYGNVNTLGERSCYDEGKRVAETLCYEYWKNYNVDIRLVRIFNTYGPFMRKDDGRVVSSFINKILNNEKVQIYGNGEQTRSFCYISDLIDGIIKIMEISEFGPINLGNPEEISINKLYEIIKKLLRDRYPYIENQYIRKRPDDPKKRKPDIKKIVELTGWYPKTSLIEGLNKTIAFYENYYNDKNAHLYNCHS